MPLFYEAVLRGLEEKGIRYLIAGGLAVNLHGVPRATVDLDLVLALDARNLKAFLDLMAELGFRPRVPVDPRRLLDPDARRRWAEEKGMKAFTFFRGGDIFGEVDVLIDPAFAFEEMYLRRKTIDLGGWSLSVTSLEDLKGMKRAAGREQDRADVEMLECIERLLAEEREPPPS